MKEYSDSRFLAAGDVLIYYRSETDEFMYLPSRLGEVIINEIGSGSMSCPLLKTLIVPEGVEKFNSNAILYSPKLRDLRLPATLKTVVGNLFHYHSDLKEINFSAVEYTEEKYGVIHEASVKLNDSSRLMLNPSANAAACIKDSLKSSAVFIPENFNLLFEVCEKASEPLGDKLKLINENRMLVSTEELRFVKQLINSGIKTYLDEKTENEADMSLAGGEIKVPDTVTAIINTDKTTFSGGNVYLNITLKKGLFFFPSLVPISDTGGQYYLYRRCFLSGDKKLHYIPRDIAVFDSSGAQVDSEKANEIYEKYEFMRIM